MADSGLQLRSLLDGTVDDDRMDIHFEAEATKQQLQQAVPTEGFCTECEDQQRELYCEQCRDDFCKVCFTSVHRKGTRKLHSTKSLVVDDPINAQPLISTPSLSNSTQPSENIPTASLDLLISENDGNLVKGDLGDWFLQRSKYIPLRLTHSERKFLRLLEAALSVSEYTDKIDILSYTSKSKRIVGQIREFCGYLTGLVVAADYKVGQELINGRNFADNAVFFQDVFELGKLLYMLQDSQMPEIKELLQFNCVVPIKTVYKILDDGNALLLLKDELMIIATQEIIPSKNKTRNAIQLEIKKKERAIEILAKRYSSKDITDEKIKQCLYSIGDNHAFLRANRDPCDHMISYLKRYINPEKAEPQFSLAISYGKGGSRLSHDHTKQYNYVLQSLTLWREILHDMFQLWMNAEEDLLSETNSYRLRDTGQGLNRVQNAPRVSRMMQTILQRAQQKVGYWVGSSVVHLGDHNVPNALIFIDKYTQIYRILLPFWTTLEKLEDVAKEDDGVSKYITQCFISIETAKKAICCDFFKYAFDGSGADNNYDAGSCIDGRLTSAWNWCSKIEKKSYFPLFLLAEFSGFDGHFN